MARNYYEVFESLDGYQVNEIGIGSHHVAFFRKAEGWTRLLVDEAVRTLCRVR